MVCCYSAVIECCDCLLSSRCYCNHTQARTYSFLLTVSLTVSPTVHLLFTDRSLFTYCSLTTHLLTDRSLTHLPSLSVLLLHDSLRSYGFRGEYGIDHEMVNSLEVGRKWLLLVSNLLHVVFVV
jgi:hypothetical protein